ncbi:MAG: galactose oxidase-like domain-containing protein [Acidobacteriota bacterium]
MGPHRHGPEHGATGAGHHEETPDHIVTAEGHEHERLVPPPLDPGDPGPEQVEKSGGKKHPIFLPDGGSWSAPRSASNPSPKGSFGYVGSFVELPSDARGHRAGTLVFPILPERLGGVARGTLRVFRWDAADRGWLPVRSAPGQTRDYVWARAGEPGIYGLIGLHTDPLIARTLGLLSLMRGWLETSAEGFGADLSEKTCRLLLCDPEARKRLRDLALYRALVEDNLRHNLPGVWLPTRPGEEPERAPLPEADPCAICLELREAYARRSARSGTVHPPELAMLAMTASTPADAGEWALVEPSPAADNDVLSVHAALLRTGRILYFGGSENVGAQNVAGGAAIDKTRLFDPDTGAITVLGSPPRYDLFCCGHALLPDGRLLAAGGTKGWGGVSHPNHGTNFEGLRLAAVFEPDATPGQNPWTPVARLCPERGQTRGGGAWYPTLTTLPDGRVLRAAGPPEYEDSHRNNPMLEVFDPDTGTWTDQGPAADLPIGAASDLPQYPRLHALPDGRVFCPTPMTGPPMGPAGRSWFWNPATGAWSAAGSGPGGEFVGFDTSSVLLPLRHAQNYRARVLYTNRHDAKLIDLSATSPAWQTTSPRALSDPITGPPVRYHATAVLLADGTVMVSGGHSDPSNWNPPVLVPELFDPSSDTWSTLAAAAVPRVYHSVALLLPDGRVWTAGSDYGSGSHEFRMEIYSPPYLFRGPRPVISAAPDAVTVGTGSSFEIQTPDPAAVATVALVRCGTATHAFGIDQRWVDLAIKQLLPGKLVVSAPANTNLTPPGYYMLFLLDHGGVPSVAKILRVQASNRPTISSLEPRSGPSAGGAVVKIRGTNFQTGAAVSFGGVPAAAVIVAGEKQITATAPALPAGALHDVVVTNPDHSTRTLAKGWLSDFLDVPAGHLFHDAIERLFRAGVTAGCGGGNFCPDDPVTRAQMAVFLMRAEHGSGYTAPAASGTLFADVPGGSFGAGAIEQAASEGIFPGGGAFGPNAPVDRAEMAGLLLRAEHGPGYAPPAATGIFLDVPAAHPAAPWIERLFHEAITAGCGGGNYCPNDTSTRGQMAVFLVKTFGLP